MTQEITTKNNIYYPILAILVLFMLLFSSCGGGGEIGNEKQKEAMPLSADAILKKDFVLDIMEKVANWQLNHLDTVGGFADRKNTEPLPDNGWVRGAFMVGLFEAHQVLQKTEYLDAMLQRYNNLGWQPGPRATHADDHCIMQTYGLLSKATNNPDYIKPSLKILDSIAQLPYLSKNVGWKPDGPNWWWCDALFMAPPSFMLMSALTGDTTYLAMANAMYFDTKSWLYAEQDSLWYRDKNFIQNDTLHGQLTENGKKVFWGRGNGWVIAGHCKMLEYMPQNYKYKPQYEDMFKKMAYKIAHLQGQDGMWRSSLLDYDAYPQPESSCTGFFTYALAWGINQGYLPQSEFMPIVKKGWKELVNAVTPQGKLGWVQLIGHDPR